MHAHSVSVCLDADAYINDLACGWVINKELAHLTKEADLYGPSREQVADLRRQREHAGLRALQLLRLQH